MRANVQRLYQQSLATKPCQTRMCNAGQEVAPEDIVNEFVPREAFIAESTELLEGAMQEQKILERSWRAG